MNTHLELDNQYSQLATDASQSDIQQFISKAKQAIADIQSQIHNLYEIRAEEFDRIIIELEDTKEIMRQCTEQFSILNSCTPRQFDSELSDQYASAQAAKANCYNGGPNPSSDMLEEIDAEINDYQNTIGRLQSYINQLRGPRKVIKPIVRSDKQDSAAAQKHIAQEYVIQPSANYEEVRQLCTGKSWIEDCFFNLDTENDYRITDLTHIDPSLTLEDMQLKSPKYMQAYHEFLTLSSSNPPQYVVDSYQAQSSIISPAITPPYPTALSTYRLPKFSLEWYNYTKGRKYSAASDYSGIDTFLHKIVHPIMKERNGVDPADPNCFVNNNKPYVLKKSTSYSKKFECSLGAKAFAVFMNTQQDTQIAKAKCGKNITLQVDHVFPIGVLDVIWEEFDPDKIVLKNLLSCFGVNNVNDPRLLRAVTQRVNLEHAALWRKARNELTPLQKSNLNHIDIIKMMIHIESNLLNYVFQSKAITENIFMITSLDSIFNHELADMPCLPIYQE
jgi:hypothetical protein